MIKSIPIFANVFDNDDVPTDPPTSVIITICNSKGVLFINALEMERIDVGHYRYDLEYKLLKRRYKYIARTKLFNGDCVTIGLANFRLHGRPLKILG